MRHHVDMKFAAPMSAVLATVHHSGELDGALIDHPEIEPVDGRFLNNVLRINDEVVDHETFVVVP